MSLNYSYIINSNNITIVIVLSCFVCLILSQIIDKIYRDYCCRSDRTVSVWEWRSGHGFEEKSYSPLTHHKYMVTGVQFDGDANILATSSLDGSTTLCDVEVRVYIIILFLQPRRGLWKLEINVPKLYMLWGFPKRLNSNTNICVPFPPLSW
jgi:WD40 repeat protein